MTSDVLGEELSYGYDLLGGLRKDLKTLQGFRTVVQELIQNAEDARDLGGRHARHFWLDFRDDALWVGNDGEFTDENFAAISRIGAGSKRYDEATIGSFGVGFVSVYQITDQPEVSSRGERRTLFPLEGKTRRLAPVSHPWPSTFRLPWADQPSSVREGLEALPVDRADLPTFQEDAKVAFGECAIFLRHLTDLTLLQDGEVVYALRIERPDPRTVHVHGSDGTLTSYRLYPLALPQALRLEAAKRGRKTDLILACPAGPAPEFQGHLYAYLPTREPTGLPLHVNADFYPNTDRKGLLWDEPDKRRWNEALLLHAAGAVREVLTALRDHAGAEALYGFAAQVERSARRLHATASPLAAFAREAWQACQAAFAELPLYLGRHGRWVSRRDFLTIGLPHDRVLPSILESQLGWVLPPDEHAGYQGLFRALGADELNVPVYFQALHALFGQPPAWFGPLDATSTLGVFLDYLAALERQFPVEVKAQAQKLDGLHLAFNVQQLVRPLRELRHCPAEHLPAVQPWLGDAERVTDGWLEAVPAWLRERVPTYRPEDLADAQAGETPESIAAWVQGGWDPAGAYRFLVRDPRLAGRRLRDLPIYRTQQGAYARGHHLALPRGLRDPFGVREVLDVEAMRGHAVLLERLALETLDAPTYYGKLLPEHFQAKPDERRAVIEHLATIYSQVGDVLAPWKTLPCAECVDGQWRPPHGCFVPNEVMDQLFGDGYPKFHQDAYLNVGVQGLMTFLGVRAAAGNTDIVEQLRTREREPVTAKNVAVRQAVLEYALQQPGTMLAQMLTMVAWLPNERRTGWRKPGQLFTLHSKGLIGEPPGVEFCALDVPRDARREPLKALGFAAPTSAQVLAHIRRLNAGGTGPTPRVLDWLNGNVKVLTDSDVVQLGQMNLFAYPDSSKQASYARPDFFFLKDPGLGRWRHTMKSGAFKELVKRLGLREGPDVATYRDVLLSIAAAHPSGQTPSPEDMRVAERCFHELSMIYARLKPEERAGFVQPLRGKRLVPVVGRDPQRGTLAYPKDALSCDMPTAWLERFNFPQHNEAYVRERLSNKTFLAALGVAALSECHQVEYRPQHGHAGLPLPRLNEKLQTLAPALLRLLFKEKGQGAVKEAADLITRLRFVQTGRMEATVRAQGEGFRIVSQCELDAAYDADTARLLVSSAAPEYGSEVLAAAFRLAVGAPYMALHSVWQSASLAEAQSQLNFGKFPDLPEEFQPQHVSGAVAMTSRATTERATDASAESGPLQPSKPKLPEATLRLPAAPTSPPPPQTTTGLPSSEGGQRSAAAPTDNPVPRHTASPISPPLPRPFASEPPSVRREGHQAASPRPSRSGEGTGSTRGPQRRFQNYVYVYEGPNESLETEAHAQKVDRQGMAHAMEYERQQGRTPEDCSEDYGAGYDIFSKGPDGSVRHIELKTVSGPWGERGVTLSRNQFAAARKYGAQYWLYIVENLDDQPVLRAIQHPEGQVTYYVFNDSWRDNAVEAEELLL